MKTIFMADGPGSQDAPRPIAHRNELREKRKATNRGGAVQRIITNRTITEATKTEAPSGQMTEGTDTQETAASQDDERTIAKKTIVAAVQNKYVLEHSGENGINKEAAETAFAQQLAILEDPDSDAHAILAAKENMGMAYSQLTDYLQGDERRDAVGIEASIEGINRLRQQFDEVAEHDGGGTPETRAQIDALITPWGGRLHELFTSDDRPTLIKTAAEFVPVAEQYFPNDPQALEKCLELFGYTNTTGSFFTDAQDYWRAHRQIQETGTGPQESVTPAPASGPPASGNEDLSAAPVEVESEARTIANAATEATRDLVDPDATPEKKAAANERIKQIIAQTYGFLGNYSKYSLGITGILLAAVILPTLLVASVHGGSGK